MINMADHYFDKLMTVDETAEFLHVSRNTVYSLMNSGKLSFTTVGRNRRVPRRAVLDMLNAGLRR